MLEIRSFEDRAVRVGGGSAEPTQITEHTETDQNPRVGRIDTGTKIQFLTRALEQRETCAMRGAI